MRGKLYGVVAATILLPLGGLAYVLFVGEVIALRADQSVIVSKIPSYPAAGEDVLGTIASGDRVTVLDCEDFKSDIALRVRLPSGAVGYVREGAFGLERRGVTLGLLFRSYGDVVLSCQGWYEHRSEPWAPQ